MGWDLSHVLRAVLSHKLTDLLPRDGVTRAHIADWVREAYLARIGVEYPLDERKRMQDVINDEKDRPFKDRKYKVLSADNVCRVF